MGWRPEDWEIITDRDMDLSAADIVEEKLREQFEAGADAMLEALKKEGWHLDKDEVKDFIETGPGWLVFIPEDKE